MKLLSKQLFVITQSISLHFAYLKSDLQLTVDLDLCFSTNRELC